MIRGREIVDCPNDLHLVRMIGKERLGSMIGQVKEIVEASISDKEQRTALKNIITDKIYEWFTDIGEKITVDEMNDIMREHWKSDETRTHGLTK